jgi:hypothetical protein
MNEFRNQFLKERDEKDEALFEKIKDNPSPDVLDLWALSEKRFIEWRKLNDFPKLLSHFDKKLELFKEWKQDNKLTDEIILSTGKLTPFLENKKLSKNKKLYYIKQIINGKESFFVGYEKLNGTKKQFGLDFIHETVLEFYPYQDWLNQRGKKQNILYINSRNAPESKYERVFIHNDIYDTTSDEFELLKMGGIEAPVNGFGILLRGKQLEFVNLCGLKLSGEIHFGEEGNLGCSYCACDNMIAEDLNMSLLTFEHCSISNFTVTNSKIQQWKFYNCTVSGDFSNSQFRIVGIWGGHFNPVMTSCNLIDVEFEKDRILEDNNFFAYQLLKKQYADQGDDSKAIKYFLKEKEYRRKKSKGLVKISRTLSHLYWGYGRKPQRIIWTSISLVFLFSIVVWFNRELIIMNNGNPTELSFWDCLYFSTTTFTTLGYGDFSPVGIMRVLSSLVSFGGVLNAGFLVAGFASNKY